MATDFTHSSNGVDYFWRGASADKFEAEGAMELRDHSFPRAVWDHDAPIGGGLHEQHPCLPRSRKSVDLPMAERLRTRQDVGALDLELPEVAHAFGGVQDEHAAKNACARDRHPYGPTTGRDAKSCVPAGGWVPQA